MKISYNHLIECINSKPDIESISSKLFQLGHEHEIENEIFDIEFTPNRGDCLSVNGLLRDLSVFYDINFNNKVFVGEIPSFKFNFINKAREYCQNISFLKVDIDNEVLEYRGDLLNYFNVMKDKKINFFTDISNFISYETGQPTHCYDYKKLGNNLELDYLDGEHEFETLHNDRIQLHGENLLFHQGNNIVNLAGVMGGKSTSCTNKTKSVIIECAHFAPEAIIGKTVKYNLKSDAAYKFERGVDPCCHDHVLRRFLNIIEEHTSIKKVEIFSDQTIKKDPLSIKADFLKINEILGIQISKEEYYEHLSKLRFIVNDDTVLVPSFRNDVKTCNDLAEEIARVIGYNNIQEKKINIAHVKDNQSKDSELQIKTFLINHGFYEVINSPFTSKQNKKSIKVDNPLDKNRQYLRTTLETSLIDNLLYNERRQKNPVKLFEFSDMYMYEKNKIIKKRFLGIIGSGIIEKNYLDFSKKINVNYLDKIIVEIFPNRKPMSRFIKRDSLDSKLNNEIIYFESELENIDINNFGIIDEYKYKPNIETKYQPISEYPSSYRDLSFAIHKNADYKELQKMLLNFEHNLLKEVFIFDFFVNKKSQEIKIGFRFTFQSKEKTVTDEDVNTVMGNIIKLALSLDSIKIPGLKPDF